MNKRKLILLIIIGIIAIPLTVLVAQRQQQIRQRAAPAENPSLYFTMKDSLIPVTRFSIPPKQSISLSLFLNPELKDINGFDISIQSSTSLKITKTVEGPGAQQFNALIFNRINPQTNTLIFTKVSSNTNAVINGIEGDLNLLNITLTADEREDNGTLSVSQSKIISATQKEGFLPTAPLPSIAFTIQAPAPTATPTATPVPTPLPGSSLLTLSLKVPGIGTASAENLPRTKSRRVKVIVRTAAKDIEKEGVIIFSPSDGTFKTDPKRPVDLGTSIPINTPLDLVIKADFFKGFVSNISLSPGPNPAPQIPALQVGLDDSGNVDAVSYFNVLTSCFGQKSCTNKLAADLNDDGSVDGIDFNIFLKSIRTITSR